MNSCTWSDTHMGHLMILLMIDPAKIHADIDLIICFDAMYMYRKKRSPS